MTHNHEQALNANFACQVRDVTPPDLKNALCVLYMPTTADPMFLQHCRSSLDRSEVDDLAALTRAEDQTQFIVRRAFRRYCAGRAVGCDSHLSDIQFECTETGRPFLSSHPNISFSFSTSSKGYIAAWSARFSVGVDIENSNRAVEAIDLADLFFISDEADDVRCKTGADQRRVFFQLWTLKEAALKSIGQGLSFGLDAFTFSVTHDIQITSVPKGFVARDAFQARALKNIAGCASLVIH